MHVTRHQDAFGLLVTEAAARAGVMEIVERDDGFVGVGSAARYFAPFRRWPPHERSAMRYVRGRVLDVGCGAGRVALHLQARGHDVVGIDASPGAVAVCLSRGVKDARLVRLADVRAEQLGTFDTIVMLGNNFGLFESKNRAPALLRRLRKVLNEGGRIIAESRDPYGGDDPSHLAYHEQNRARGRMGGQVRIRVRHRELATSWFDYLHVSRDEMEDLAETGGWRVTRFIPTTGTSYVALLQPRR